MRPKNTGRVSFREQLRKNNAWLDFYGVPKVDAKGNSLRAEIKPKRERAPKPEGVDIDAAHKLSTPTERVVLKAVLRDLQRHPRVASVWRMTSGVFQSGDRFIRVGESGMPDVMGMLAGGRLFAVEVKRPGAKPTSIQQIQLDRIRINGGLSGCAHSSEEAIAIIEGRAPQC
jgi:hypothetical protein